MNPTNPFVSPAYVRSALRTLQVRPTRGMGQNFLTNAHILEQIIEAADLARDDVVIEVGPGLGVLTWELIRRAGEVVSVELDKRFAARLQEELTLATQTTHPRHTAHHAVIQGDILTLSPTAILQHTATLNHPYKVVANLPYAITSPVLRHFLEHSPRRPSLMVVLVQWEVARRIVAAPGNYNMLAHAIQMYAQPEIVSRVGAKHFVPPPAVDSALLRLWVRETPAVTCDDEHTFFRVMKAGFLQPRKKLSNSLPGGLAALGVKIPRETAVAALQEAGVSPDRRAETLTLIEWNGVYTALREREISLGET